MAFTIKVNGQTYSLGVGGDMPLLWVLRNLRLEAVVIPVSDVRNSAAAMVRLALAAALCPRRNLSGGCAELPSRLQDCARRMRAILSRRLRGYWQDLCVSPQGGGGGGTLTFTYLRISILETLQ